MVKNRGIWAVILSFLLHGMIIGGGIYLCKKQIQSGPSLPHIVFKEKSKPAHSKRKDVAPFFPEGKDFPLGWVWVGVNPRPTVMLSSLGGKRSVLVAMNRLKKKWRRDGGNFISGERAG